MKKTRYFTLLASALTGESVDNIKIISFEQDIDGKFSGVIEIDGYRENIHEYHN